MTAAHRPLPVEYVIPLRWADDRNLPELTQYLRDLHTWVDVTVVDGSDAELFAAHAAAWPMVRHLPVGDWPGRNRKVAGVVTGVRAARHECVVIADDDVRYRPEQLAEMLSRLAGADLVRPQNVFQPLPWHARWDTARSLLNRAFGSDYPGTFGIRRSAFKKVGGYDGDVLFENLQLIRTISAAGGREAHAARRARPAAPPGSQRVPGQQRRMGPTVDLGTGCHRLDRNSGQVPGRCQVPRPTAADRRHPALPRDHQQATVLGDEFTIRHCDREPAMSDVPDVLAEPAGPTRMTICPDGPLLVRGPAQIVDSTGEIVPRNRPTIALCRCGKSRLTPLCDGTHKLSSRRAGSPTTPE